MNRAITALGTNIDKLTIDKLTLAQGGDISDDGESYSDSSNDEPAPVLETARKRT
jgi:hypothetical protein